MAEDVDSHLEQRLRKAEEAEYEVNRLESLAAEAPKLRLELARTQRRQEREGNKKTALDQARKEIQAAQERQTDVPLTLEMVCELVSSLYALLKDVDSHRKEATRLMGIVDRMDYEEELETSEEEQTELGRDPQGLEYLIASRHGQPRIKQLIDELDPDFGFLQDCDIEEPLKRDVANFILSHVISSERLNQEKNAATDAISQDRNVPAEPQEANLIPKEKVPQNN